MRRSILAELLGSALLTAIVVGSGIAASQLSDDVGIRLLINAIATAFGLFVLIAVFAPISGAHLNPVVTLVDVAERHRPAATLLGYLPAQFVGCIAGAVLANLMFGRAAVSWSTTERATPAHLLGEVVATAGLVLVIFLLARTGHEAVTPVAVAAYIGSAYFFTSSTSFANPAITVGRLFSDSFAGIAPGSAPWFVGAQLVGGAVGMLLVRGLASGPTPTTP